MKTITGLIVLSIIFTFVLSRDDACRFTTRSGVEYDLNGAESSTGYYKITGPDPFKSQQATTYINICGPAKIESALLDECSYKTSPYYLFRIDTQKKEVTCTSGSLPQIEYIYDTNKGVSITYEPYGPATDRNRMRISINLECDEKAANDQVTDLAHLSTSYSSVWNLEYTGKSKAACKNQKDKNYGAIIGGVVGGVAFVVILVAAAIIIGVVIHKRREKSYQNL
ncbi:protein transport protein SEC31 [Acrasis kona]|uniref:Protein transport protein SEC31 n=1 Tax=Acrasis kona TaxID=1008807 RepID=A0AAW2YKE5_9EUKA